MKSACYIIVGCYNIVDNFVALDPVGMSRDIN